MKQQTNARTCIHPDRACPSPRTVRKNGTPSFAIIVKQTFYFKIPQLMQNYLTVLKKRPTRHNRTTPIHQVLAPEWLWNKPPPNLYTYIHLS